MSGIYFLFVCFQVFLIVIYVLSRVWQNLTYIFNIFTKNFKSRMFLFLSHLSSLQFKIEIQDNIQKFKIYIKFCLLFQIILCS